jgi:hypothetical protein
MNSFWNAAHIALAGLTGWIADKSVKFSPAKTARPAKRGKETL